MTTKATTVWVTTSFIGFHCWADAPKEVGYLKTLHRDKFNVKVWVRVKHDDRDVEFHTLQSLVNQVIATKVFPELQTEHTLSCEMMASMVGAELESKYKIQCAGVEVDEDGECGAIITIEE